MNPARFFFACVLACCLCASVVAAQDATIQPWPGTGDARLDLQLQDINDYAARYPGSFADEMARYHAVPRGYVEAMLLQPGWQAGDVYMACALARVAGQPCRAVVREWARDHAGGWKAVAARLEVEPGTAQFRRLRQGVQESYTRWSRPLPRP